jgi:hypothetical protein
VRLSFWSDENRWFVPRKFGFGYSLNFKYVFRRLGWIRPRLAPAEPPENVEAAAAPPGRPSREERLRKQIESSKYEDDR